MSDQERRLKELFEANQEIVNARFKNAFQEQSEKLERGILDGMGKCKSSRDICNRRI